MSVLPPTRGEKKKTKQKKLRIFLTAASLGTALLNLMTFRWKLFLFQSARAVFMGKKQKKSKKKCDQHPGQQESLLSSPHPAPRGTLGGSEKILVSSRGPQRASSLQSLRQRPHWHRAALSPGFNGQQVPGFESTTESASGPEHHVVSWTKMPNFPHGIKTCWPEYLVLTLEICLNICNYIGVTWNCRKIKIYSPISVHFW